MVNPHTLLQGEKNMAFEWSIIVVILQLIFLEGILSIDNAAVIGALVSPLPDNQPVQWSPSLKRLGQSLHRVLGNQRTAALRVGLLGAYLGRGLMLFMAGFVIQNPWIKLVGAVYLIRLAFDSLGEMTGGGSEDEDDNVRPIKVQTFWTTVLTVEIMDLIFSIDNVVAAVSLSDKFWVVMTGVAIGILTMRFAAGFFSYAVEREPILKTAAYLLVLSIGIELILEEIWHIGVSDIVRFGISISIILLSLAYAHLPWLQKLRFILVWLGQGIGIINEFIDWLLLPIKGVFGLLSNIIHLFTGVKASS
jgi:tellurite resistance protein TerC